MIISVSAFLLFPAISVNAQSAVSKANAIEITKQQATDIAQKSFPEIKLKKLHFKTFESDSNYFKARFSYGRFLTFQRMRHLIYVNPRVFDREAPEIGIRAILAHELAHILYYTEKNRFQLLGLARLSSGSFTRRFERKADLEAISRGYGEGLIVYRKWLYKNIPDENLAAKRKNYFSPEEINLLLEILKKNPGAIKIWRKDVPISIDEIRKSA